MTRRIAILGCGWLGLPLAKFLVGLGYRTKGSTTSQNKLSILEGAGIEPYLIALSENAIEGQISEFLFEIDVLVINIPPKLRRANAENYFKKMEHIHKAARSANIEHLLFVSSTSVYGDISGTVTERTDPRPNTASGKQLLASERLFRNTPEFKTTVVRFGGLIGKDRHPIHRLSGKKSLANGNHPINLIHLDDCIGILHAIIDHGWWNHVFNAVYPYHPSKKEYYTAEAKKRNLTPPGFSDSPGILGKKIDSSTINLVKLYDFKASIQS